MGADLVQVRFEVSDELQAVALDVLLVAPLVLGEPFPVVVRGEILEVGEEGGTEGSVV